MYILNHFRSSLEALSLCQYNKSPLTHWFPKTASKAALYAGDSMKQVDYTAMKHLFSVLATFSDLLLGCSQLCLSLLQLHKGVTSKVCVHVVFSDFTNYFLSSCCLLSKISSVLSTSIASLSYLSRYNVALDNVFSNCFLSVWWYCVFGSTVHSCVHSTALVCYIGRCCMYTVFCV